VCPACKEAMIVVEFEGVEVDYCANCHGVWLDTGELELITELAGSRTGPLEAALGHLSSARHGRRRCPRCRRKMRILPVLPQPIELDACPAGHGLWFDAGELAAIVQGAGGAANSHVADFLGQLFQQNTGHTKEG
jgi:Zn-finger nucleic acid-binding protein